MQEMTKPIKDKKLISKILSYCRVTNERNYILFLMGIHTGLRISDLLRIKVKDVINKDFFVCVEKKTGKRKEVIINDELYYALYNYCKGKQYYEYLFKSRQGYNIPIDRVRAYQILKEIGEVFGIHISCHTLRKTYGYHHYKLNKDIAELMISFNHSSQHVTKRYIGIEIEEMRKNSNKLRFE